MSTSAPPARSRCRTGDWEAQAPPPRRGRGHNLPPPCERRRQIPLGDYRALLASSSYCSSTSPSGRTWSSRPRRIFAWSEAWPFSSFGRPSPPCRRQRSWRFFDAGLDWPLVTGDRAPRQLPVRSSCASSIPSTTGSSRSGRGRGRSRIPRPRLPSGGRSPGRRSRCSCAGRSGRQFGRSRPRSPGAPGSRAYNVRCCFVTPIAGQNAASR